MSSINEREVRMLGKDIEQLPGLELFLQLNMDDLSTEDKARYVVASSEYYQVLKSLANKLPNDRKNIMCHEIVFDMEQVFQPYDNRWLKEYPLYLTKYAYSEVPKDNLGLHIRELNKWMQVYIPDPQGIISKDEAVEKAITEAQEYLDNKNRVFNDWLSVRYEHGREKEVT